MLDPCHTKVDTSQPGPLGAQSLAEEKDQEIHLGKRAQWYERMTADFAGLDGASMEATAGIPEMPVARIDRDPFRVKLSPKPCSQQVGR